MNPLQSVLDAILQFLQTLVTLLGGFFDAFVAFLQAILGAIKTLF